MKKITTLFLSLISIISFSQVKLVEKDLKNLIRISELYSKNPNATGNEFAKSLDSLRTKKLNNICDVLIEVGKAEKTILTDKYLSKPNSEELLLWYVIREIHYNQVSETKSKRPNIDVANEVLSQKIDERWLLDNYYYRIHGGIAKLFNESDLSKINIDIEKLPIIDVEFYFVNLRAKSVGEIVESKYRCNNVVNGNECGNIMEHSLDLQKIKVQMNDEISSEIQITPKIVVKLKYPEFGIVKNSMEFTDINDITFNMIARSIEYIYDGEQFYYASETQPQELVEFVESMNQEQFAKIENFFNNLPKLKETVDITCSKCGFHHKIDVEGLENFFG